MGYYTQYSGEYSGPPEAEEEFRNSKQIIFESGYDLSPEDFENYIFWDEGTKWYSYKEDMLSYSRQFPEILFEISGIGEEQPDMWKHYFKNGKEYRSQAVITYPPFDESEMS